MLSPVLRKELTQLAGSNRVFLLRCGFLAVLAVVTYIAFPAVQLPGTSPGLAYFRAVVGALIIAVAVITPMLTSGAIAGELQARTIGLLFITRLTPFNITADKALSRIAFVLFICELTLPFMFAAMLLGGVSGAQIVGALVRVLFTALVCGGLSIYMSAIRPTYVLALISTYVYILVGTALVSMFTFVFFSNRVFYGIQMTIVAPVQFFRSHILDVSSFARPQSIFTFLFLGVATFIVFLSKATRRVERLQASGNALDPQTAASDGLSARTRLRLPGVKLLRASSELQPGLFQRIGTFVQRTNYSDTGGCLLVFAVVLAGIVFSLLVSSHDAYGLAMTLIVPIVLVLTALHSACAIPTERHMNRLDIVLTANQPGKSIVTHTYLSALRSLAPLWVLVLGLHFFGTIFHPVGPDEWVALILASLHFLVTANTLVIIGLATGLASRSHSVAMTRLGIVLLLYLGLPIGLAALLRFYAVDESWFLARLSALTWMIYSFDHAELLRELRYNDLYLCVTGMIQLGLSAAVFLAMRLTFNRLMHRQPD